MMSENDLSYTDLSSRISRAASCLRSEIMQAELRKDEKYNPMFNGVDVGHEKQIELNSGHIRFCKDILKIMGFEYEEM